MGPNSFNQSDGFITVCIPAYQSGPFISQTLRSLQAQVLRNFDAIISIDGNDEQTLERCRPFLNDSRFKVVLQENRLGWVQNTNWLLARATGAYVSILPHDDLLHPYYLEELSRYLFRNPECVLAYCDTEIFLEGSFFFRSCFIQPSLRGSQFHRMERYLKENFNAVGFRSVIRRRIIDSSGFLENNRFDDFAADTLWLGKIAKQGEMHRLPYSLCKKRYHKESTHLKWHKRSVEHQKAAWKRHCLDLLKEFILGVNDEGQRKRLVKMAAERYKRVCSRLVCL